MLDAGKYDHSPLTVAIQDSTLTTFESLIQARAIPLVRARTGEKALRHCVQYNCSLVSYVERQTGGLAMIRNQRSFLKRGSLLIYAIWEGRSRRLDFFFGQREYPDAMINSP